MTAQEVIDLVLITMCILVILAAVYIALMELNILPGGRRVAINPGPTSPPEPDHRTLGEMFPDLEDEDLEWLKKYGGEGMNRELHRDDLMHDLEIGGSFPWDSFYEQVREHTCEECDDDFRLGASIHCKNNRPEPAPDTSWIKPRKMHG